MPGIVAMRGTLKGWLATLNTAGAVILLVALAAALFFADVGGAAESTPRAAHAVWGLDAPVDECPDMVEAYYAPGRALRADMTRFDYKPFDVAVAFLAFMFLAVPARRKLLARLWQQLRPGGAIIVFDKAVPPGGYPATVLARLTRARNREPW